MNLKVSVTSVHGARRELSRFLIGNTIIIRDDGQVFLKNMN